MYKQEEKVPKSLDDLTNEEKEQLRADELEELKKKHKVIMNSQGCQGYKKIRYEYRKQLKEAYKRVVDQREKDKEMLPREYQF